MQPPQSIEEIKAGLETTEKGGVRQSIRNCLTVFQRDPLLSGAIAYNILTDRKDIIKPIGFHRESTALNDTDMKYLLLYLEETYGLTNEKKIDNAIGIVANENKYHPIRDYLSALVWDGTERIRFCLRHFLGADADDYTYEALKLFLLGAISRAFQPGCKFEIMLCLVGGQGAGKSTFFRLLAVRDEWFSDDLRKLDDDNVYRKPQYVNPMDINLNYSEDDNPLALKSDFILSLCELVIGGKEGLQPVDKTVIDRAVRNVYRPFLADPDPAKMPILGDLYDELLRQPEPEAARIAAALELYVSGSLNVFNHRTNVELSNRLVCFDIKQLGKQLKKLGMLIVQDQTWNRVTINRAEKKATRYYMDEFHWTRRSAC